MKLTLDIPDDLWQPTADEAAEMGLVAEDHVTTAVLDMFKNTASNRAGKQVSALADKLKAVPADKLAAVVAAADAAATAEIAKP